MNKDTKTSSKLPMILIFGPVVMVVGSIILYAIANFIISSVSPDISSVSDGGTDQLYAGGGIFRTITNVLLFLVGSAGVLAFVPCLIFGLVLLSKRRKNEESHISRKNHEKRGWGDLE